MVCKENNENNNHLVICYPYTKLFWKELDTFIGSFNFWNGGIVEECLKNWDGNLGVKVFHVLPLIVVWGVRLSKNLRVFEHQ